MRNKSKQNGQSMPSYIIAIVFCAILLFVKVPGGTKSPVQMMVDGIKKHYDSYSHYISLP